LKTPIDYNDTQGKPYEDLDLSTTIVTPKRLRSPLWNSKNLGKLHLLQNFEFSYQFFGMDVYG